MVINDLQYFEFGSKRTSALQANPKYRLVCSDPVPVHFQAGGVAIWLWRAVDQHSFVLKEIFQSRRDRRAAKWFLFKLIKCCAFVLHDRVRKGRDDRAREAFEAVYDRDQDVLHPAVFEFGHPGRPESDPPIIGNLQAQNVAYTIPVNTESDIKGSYF